MSHRLNQVLTFTDVPAHTITSLPHDINVYGVHLVPDFIFRDNGSFTIIGCTSTELTVENTSDFTATLNAWLLRQHTFDREYGASSVTSLSPQPYIPAVGGAGSGGSTIIVEDETTVIPGNPFSTLNFKGPGVEATDGGSGVTNIEIIDAVIFDDAVPANRVNIRSDRASNQSPIVNARVGITNLGSKDDAGLGASVGATGNYSTIGGGINNSAIGNNSTVPGGQLNTASGADALAANYSTTAGGDGSFTTGYKTEATTGGKYAEAHGIYAKASREAQIATASGGFGSAEARLGTAQTSQLVMRCAVDDMRSSGTLFSLLYGDGAGNTSIALDSNRAYGFRVHAICGGGPEGATSAYIIREATVRCDSLGTASVVAAGTQIITGNPTAVADWVIEFVAPGGNMLEIQFGTGTDTATTKIKVAARVEFVECPTSSMP